MFSSHVTLGCSIYCVLFKQYLAQIWLAVIKKNKNAWITAVYKWEGSSFTQERETRAWITRFKHSQNNHSCIPCVFIECNMTTGEYEASYPVHVHQYLIWSIYSSLLVLKKNAVPSALCKKYKLNHISYSFFLKLRKLFRCICDMKHIFLSLPNLVIDKDIFTALVLLFSRSRLRRLSSKNGRLCSFLLISNLILLC